MKKLLILLTIIYCVIINRVFAGAVHGQSIYGLPKYTEDFKHFAYANPQAVIGGDITLAVVGSFDTLNPFLLKGIAGAGVQYLRPSDTYACLLIRSDDEPFSSYGYIAESFEIAPDNAWVIFTLRPEAKFHNGRPIQAKDVVFTFNTLITKGNLLFRTYYKDVKGVQALDDRRVKFTFTNPQNRELPFILGDMPILSEEFYQTNDFTKADLSLPMGSGPYKIKEMKAGNLIVYERLSNWWGSKLPIMVGHNNIMYKRYQYYRDEQIAFEAFKSGKVDFRIERIAKNWAIAYNFPLLNKGKIVKQEHTTAWPRPMIGFIFNCRRDVFKDKRVRQAISSCFDFEWMNKNLFYGLYTRSKSFFSGSELAATGMPSAAEIKLLEPFKDSIEPLLFQQPFTLPINDGSGNIRQQLTKAQALLKDAGYVIENGKLINKATKQPMVFSILLNSPDVLRVVQAFVRNVSKLGIQVDLQVVDEAQYSQHLNKLDYDMLFSGYAQSLSPGNEQYAYWHSKSATQQPSQNHPGVSDPVIDTMIEKLLITSQREELITIVKVLDRLLLWGYYLVYGYHSPVERMAYSTKLQHLALPEYGIALDTWWINETTNNTK